MKIDFNRQDDLKATVSVVLDYADYGPIVAKNTKDYSKKLNMKGFRAGKTPKSVLQKMYGKGILEETINKLLNDKLFGYLDENHIGYFGSPVMQDENELLRFDPKSQESYSFVFELGLKPDFTLQYGMDNPLSVTVPKVNHEALEESIVRYRRIFGEDTPVEEGAVENNDRVTVQLSGPGLSEEGHEANVDLERITGTAKEDLPGKTVGDKLEVELDKFLGYDRAMVVKNTLGLDQDPLVDQALNYTLTISSIHRPQTTPLTGEQLTKFVGREMEDESEFRDMLEKRDQEGNQVRVNDMKKMVIRARLQEINPFDIPEEFLLDWLNRQRDQKLEPGSREANHFLRDTKWSLLLNKIQEERKLEVSEKDVQKQVTNWVMQNVNYNQVDIRKYLEKLYQNEYFMSSMKENALEDVVFGSLIPDYTYNEKLGSAEEFEKDFHDIHHVLFDHDDHDHDHSHDHDDKHADSHKEHSH